MTSRHRLPSQAILLTLFRYDARRGILSRVDTASPCGRKVSVGNADFWSARVAWKMVTGREPRDVVVFRDGDWRNLRLKNLVELTRAEHRLLCARANASSITGARGVYPTPSGRFRAEFRHRGRKHAVGTFRTLAQAVAARRAAVRVILQPESKSTT